MIRVRQAGALRKVNSIRVMQSGVLRNVRSIRVMKEGALVFAFRKDPPQSSLAPSVRPSSTYAESFISSIRTEMLQAVVSGGFPPYSYAWSCSQQVNSPTMAATTITANQMAFGEMREATATVTITDSQGRAATSFASLTFSRVERGGGIQQ